MKVFKFDFITLNWRWYDRKIKPIWAQFYGSTELLLLQTNKKRKMTNVFTIACILFDKLSFQVIKKTGDRREKNKFFFIWRLIVCFLSFHIRV